MRTGSENVYEIRGHGCLADLRAWLLERVYDGIGAGKQFKDRQGNLLVVLIHGRSNVGLIVLFASDLFDEVVDQALASAVAGQRLP